MRFISIALALSLSLMFSLSLKAQENEMFKNPGCMCCDKWAEHMIDNGFDVKITPSPDVAKLKDVLGIPPEVRGCHTSVIDGIIVEGHVPADLVQKLINERPEGVIGISVPGMPVGSPGMEGPYKEEYRVVVFDSKGKIELYEMR